MVVVLAGGTGGAKLARGMLDVVGGDQVVVIANTGDDSEHYGVHVSPDPDLVTYWLADVIDERGWGIDGDSWTEMDRRRAAGEEIWFNLGDRDLEYCRLRTARMAAGERQTEAHAAVVEALGVSARVLPMTDEPVRTWIQVHGNSRPFQEFMIKERGADPEAVELRGIETATPSPEVTEALASADAIVIGPSNPVISIGPILAVPGMSHLVDASPAPVVAVSPFVRGDVVKGPTEAFCRMAGLPVGAEMLRQAYGNLVDGAVADTEVPGVRTHVTDVLMDTPDARRRLAEQVLTFVQRDC